MYMPSIVPMLLLLSWLIGSQQRLSPLQLPLLLLLASATAAAPAGAAAADVTAAAC
jgi:hypothetical protein